MMEGQPVAWCGQDAYGHFQGETGRLLAMAGRSSAHVMWDSGVTDLVDLNDLSSALTRSAASRGLLDDSLEMGGLSTFSVRQVYETSGEAGIINAMASVGHLSGFGQIAEEALALVATRIRQDPSFREVTAVLDEEEGERVVRLAAACLIRDAFGGEIQ